MTADPHHRHRVQGFVLGLAKVAQLAREAVGDEDLDGERVRGRRGEEGSPLHTGSRSKRRTFAGLMSLWMMGGLNECR